MIFIIFCPCSGCRATNPYSHMGVAGKTRAVKGWIEPPPPPPPTSPLASVSRQSWTTNRSTVSKRSIESVQGWRTTDLPKCRYFRDCGKEGERRHHARASGSG